MPYKDNRDIRDRKYEGDLIVECLEGVSKEEALTSIKNILQNDVEFNKNRIAEYKEKIKGLQVDIDRANLRLNEPILKNLAVTSEKRS